MNDKVYLTDPGVFKKDNVFYYHKDNKQVHNKIILKRLSQFVVPPAWISVWYATRVDSHIQVYGIDKAGKKQYILSDDWISQQNNNKYSRLKDFIKKLPGFRKKITIHTFHNDRETLIKLLFNLLLDTHIRIGNEVYAEQNKTYGLTTLLRKHLHYTNEEGYSFSFVGKSGIKHNIHIPTSYNTFMKYIIESKTAGKHLFIDNEGYNINSDMMNNYLRTHMGEKYSCKDFRTYSANIVFIKNFIKNYKKFNFKKSLRLSVECTAIQLGHSKIICKDSYISKNLLQYIEGHHSLKDHFEYQELLNNI